MSVERVPEHDERTLVRADLERRFVDRHRLDGIAARPNDPHLAVAADRPSQRSDPARGCSARDAGDAARAVDTPWRFRSVHRLFSFWTWCSIFSAAAPSAAVEIAPRRGAMEEVLAARVQRHLDVMPRFQAPNHHLHGDDVILEHPRPCARGAVRQPCGWPA